MSMPADSVIKVARFIESHLEDKLSLPQLAEIAGLSSSHLQRSFKKAFGISPKAYQNALQIAQFKQSLQQGAAVADATFASGFGSSSRVYTEDRCHLGMTPARYRAGGAGESISYAYGSTILGEMMIAATDRGVCFLQFADQQEPLLKGLAEEFPKAELAPSSTLGRGELEAWVDAVNLHLREGAPIPELPLDMRGTAFQVKVWQCLLSIKEGEQLSYAELAARLGQPKAVRAAASACAKNRIGLLIPCHRVLRSDGTLGGYRWGLERKQRLLDLESERGLAPSPHSNPITTTK